MSRRPVHYLLIISHLANVVALFLHFTALQRPNDLPTLWVFDQSSAERCGHAEKSTCKETRRKFNLGLHLRRLKHLTTGVPRGTDAVSPPAPSMGSAGVGVKVPSPQFGACSFASSGPQVLFLCLPELLHLSSGIKVFEHKIFTAALFAVTRSHTAEPGNIV